jgi:hypothetical protein
MPIFPGNGRSLTARRPQRRVLTDGTVQTNTQANGKETQNPQR